MNTLTIRTREVDGIVILDIAGEMPVNDFQRTLPDAVKNLLGDNKKRILLNTAALDSVTSVFVGQLVECLTSARNVGGQFKLLNIPKQLFDLLVITKLLTTFQDHAYENETEAIQSFFR
jgi:anti-anti-sigma factor